MQPQPMPPREAQALATDMLTWMLSDQDLVARFLATTGAGVEDIRRGLAQPEFLGSALDFLLSDEGALLPCCEALGIPPDRPMRARAGLPGGDLPHWT